MTAQAMKGDRERCLEAGMDDYMSKPLSRAVLADLVERWAPKRPPPAPPRLPAYGGESEEEGLSPLLDPSVLESLISLVDRREHAFLQGLDQLFRQDTRHRLLAMRRAIEGHDGASLAREAGEIRVSCKHLGARRMSDLCQRLQELGLTGQVDSAPAMARAPRARGRADRGSPGRLHGRAPGRIVRPGTVGAMEPMPERTLSTVWRNRVSQPPAGHRTSWGRVPFRGSASLGAPPSLPRR